MFCMCYSNRIFVGAHNGMIHRRNNLHSTFYHHNSIHVNNSSITYTQTNTIEDVLNIKDIEWIEITADDLYNAIHDKGVILSKFKFGLKEINPKRSHSSYILTVNNYFDDFCHFSICDRNM